jgi:hypothetical protein
MAAANLSTHEAIMCVMNRANTTPETAAQPEKASQTFLIGTPVQDSAGYVQAWDGTTVSAGILGISESFGQNLATSGKGAPVAPFGPITGTGALNTYGNVPNQPNAVNIPIGSPVIDGRTLFIRANADNTFEAIFDNSGGSVAADYTPTEAMINTSAGQLGLTKDANGLWYVDAAKTGASAVLQIVGVDPIDGFAVNAHVLFKFLAAAMQVA